MKAFLEQCTLDMTMDYVLKLKLDNHRTDPKKGVGLSSLEANNLHVLWGV